jgi:hypothetical protein
LDGLRLVSALPFKLFNRGSSASDPIGAEAEALAREHGPEGAIRRLRAAIAAAERPQRQRLYRLHDEIARRAGLVPVEPQPSWDGTAS